MNHTHTNGSIHIYKHTKKEIIITSICQTTLPHTDTWGDLKTHIYTYTEKKINVSETQNHSPHSHNISNIKSKWGIK